MANVNWMALLESWGPMLLIIGVWLFVMRGGTGNVGFYSNQKRAADALERIAAALEKRSL